MSTRTVGFSISGEFITEHARNLWGERAFSKALDLLDCLIGITKEQQESILFGRSKLTGVNDVALEADQWTPPEHYCPSIKDAMKQGEQFPELERRREDAAWQYAYDNYRPTRGNKVEAQAFFKRLSSMVGDTKAQSICDDLMAEYAAQHQSECEAEGQTSPVLSVAAMAHHAFKQRLEIAGFDSSALATPEAMINRGMDITPTLDNKMESLNGWLLPDGSYYKCGAMEHVGLASVLLPNVPDAEQEAEKKGWIKLVKSFTGFHCLGQRKPTKKQLTRIFDYAQRHERDYEEMIGGLPE